MRNPLDARWWLLTVVDCAAPEPQQALMTLGPCAQPAIQYALDVWNPTSSS